MSEPSAPAPGPRPDDTADDGLPGTDPQAQPVAGGTADDEPAQGEGAPDSY